MDLLGAFRKIVGSLWGEELTPEQSRSQGLGFEIRDLNKWAAQNNLHILVEKTKIDDGKDEITIRYSPKVNGNPFRTPKTIPITIDLTSDDTVEAGLKEVREKFLAACEIMRPNSSVELKATHEIK